MPNTLEHQLKAIHTSIAETKKQMEECVNVRHYETLQKQLQAYEEARLELLKLMEVEYE